MRGRRTPRRAVSCSAEIGVDGHDRMSCLVHDLSESGARLSLNDAAILPPRFSLHFTGTRHTLSAEIRWRRGDQIGVQFETPAHKIARQ